MAGSEIETSADIPLAKDCCVGTNKGQSYAVSGGNCVVPQCVGKILSYIHKLCTRKFWVQYVFFLSFDAAVSVFMRLLSPII